MVHCMVSALGLHGVAPGSNPVLTYGSNLFSVVPDSNLPSFVNSQLVDFCQLGFLIMFLLSVWCPLHSRVVCNVLGLEKCLLQIM